MHWAHSQVALPVYSVSYRCCSVACKCMGLYVELHAALSWFRHSWRAMLCIKLWMEVLWSIKSKQIKTMQGTALTALERIGCDAMRALQVAQVCVARCGETHE